MWTLLDRLHASWLTPLRKHAYLNILKILHLEKKKKKKGKISDKYFCSKHRLWVLVRTGSNEYPQSML